MGRPAQKPSIQSYNLFGEVRDLPDVVHCETIAARSVLHDWELAAHRHARLHQILLVARGGGRATMEGRTHRLRPMTAVNVPAGAVHGFSFTPGTQGWVVTLPAEILDEVVAPSEGLGRALTEATVLRGTPAMRRLMTEIFAEHRDRRFARAHILKSLSSTLLGLVARALAARQPSGGRSAGADPVRQFETMLETHYLEHWPVTRYADALKMTPTHLSRLTRAAYGCPASQMIRDRVVREARRNLVYTNLTISTIAYALGFDDPAYFSRIFASATGLSPRQFRERIDKAR